MYVYDTYMHIHRDVIYVYITSRCIRDICTYVVMYILHHDIYADVCTARSVEDETRNSHWNAKRNPNRNHETTILHLFSNFQMKRDLEQ